ncbi:MAG: hypothetical protein K8T90_15620 [Planctomycetes bacterium]|nr:hypothetical protein [Planctomycetota bacterium]
MQTHLDFTIGRRELVDRILIPKFYDPAFHEAARLARAKFELPRLEELLLPGRQGSALNVWLPRELYGTGEIPFIRTSDLFHWRIRPDFKKGVSQAAYEQYRRRCDVAADDILFVAHGSYLIGDVAIVRAEDVPLLVSDHVFRLRVRPDAGVHPYLLLAALSTRFVRRQVRARQFSAEIIDKIGERHLGIQVPIPSDASVRAKVVESVRRILELHAEVRTNITLVSETSRSPGPRAGSQYGFRRRRSTLVNRVLIPRYYDPDLEAAIAAAESLDGQSWVTIGALADDGVLNVSTGVEVGKMAYGTGRIPFIRTSDVVDWELYRDPTQGVSEGIHAKYTGKGSLQVDDVVLVRDGTYLVGSSALVLDEDLPALFCGGICRLRVAKRDVLSPHVLLGLLNLPLVRRQLRCKQFTRDVIDTLGHRLLEVRVPAPESRTLSEVQEAVERVMRCKGEIKRRMVESIELMEPAPPPSTSGRPGWSMR